MENSFCIEALNETLMIGKTDIFNTDQGSQFSSHEFTKCLLQEDIKISMDGKGRAFDNIFIERLWRSVKYENIYPNSYETCSDARKRISEYFEFYNNERLHHSLNYETPAFVYQPEVMAERGTYEKSLGY